jgi:hypothetical protein
MNENSNHYKLFILIYPENDKYSKLIRQVNIKSIYKKDIEPADYIKEYQIIFEMEDNSVIIESFESVDGQEDKKMQIRRDDRYHYIASQIAY